MDMPVNVPVDDPNADTEWNDILRKHGIIPEKPPSPTPIIQEAILEARQKAHENRLENKDLDELAELEDEEDEEFLQQYRDKRMAELSTISKTSIYNQPYPISKPDYGREVTEASKTAWVLVLLTATSAANMESARLGRMWHTLAKKFGDVKFCLIRADLCIEGYPERNMPTILIYKDGDVKRQIVTLRELRGTETSVEDMEGVLISVGAVGKDDSRLTKKDAKEQGQLNKSIRSGGRTAAAASDSDDLDD